MSNVIYYSNYCENSKKVIKALNAQKGIHWLCIDKRVKEGNTTYILLENGQKVVLPPNINRIPALLSLSTYQTTFGNDILGMFSSRVEQQTVVATQGNMEPIAFSFGGGGGGGVASDGYSSWDLNPEDLAARGNGGIAQMHNYVGIDHMDTISPTVNESDYKKGSRSGGTTDSDMERIMAQRAADLKAVMNR